MINQNSKKRIFLGHSFTNLLENGLVNMAVKSKIETIIKILESKGHKVNCALTREEFGKKLMGSSECTLLDFEEIKKCDVFLTFPSNSGGVHIELGWASALSKDIILFLHEEEKHSPLVHGLSELTNVKIINYNKQNLFEKLNELVEHSEEEIEK